jgi:hypothetical protein
MLYKSDAAFVLSRLDMTPSEIFLYFAGAAVLTLLDSQA